MIHIRQLALAVFEIAKKRAEIQKIISQLEELDFQLRINRKYRFFLFNPQQSLPEKQKLVKQIFKNRISNQVINLISLLIQKRILTKLNLLIGCLKKIRNQKFNLAEARIVSPLPLTTAEEDEIRKLIGKKINKKIILKPETNPKILTGLIIQVEDNLIDLSLKIQLEKLEENLAK